MTEKELNRLYDLLEKFTETSKKDGYFKIPFYEAIEKLESMGIFGTI